MHNSEQHLPRKLYGIYTVEAGQSLDIADMKQRISTALTAGLAWLQIRDKTKSRKLWPTWLWLAQQAQQKGVQLIINDHVDLVYFLLEQLPSAPNTQKPGLHLGQTDTSLHKARQYLGDAIIIGVTCHNSLALAAQAIDQGAHYVAFGRFFPSTTKPEAPPASYHTLQQFQQAYNHPIPKYPIAVIGGINQHTIAPLLATPATLFAVSAGLWQQDCVSRAVKRLNTLLE